MTASPPARPMPWANPTLLAPLEGVGHAAVRELIAAHGGLGMVCMEFLRVGGSPVHARSLLRRIKRTASLPLSVQLLGSDKNKLAEAAQIVARSGAEVVDINLGCPVKRVVGKGAGAALLRDPERLHRLLSHVRASVPTPLSAKIRAGWDDTSQVDAIGDAVAGAGIDFITVHPRSRAAHYTGVADWTLIRRLKQRLPIPVVGNGDCWYARDVLRMQRQTACDAVMVGRPALRNPWIFAQAAALRAGLKPPPVTGGDVVAYLERAVSAFNDTLPPRPQLITGRLKELVRYLGRAVPDRGTFVRQALRCADTDALLSLAARELGTRSADSLDLDADGHLGLEQSGSTGT